MKGRKRRQKRVRKKIFGTGTVPRVSVFRSNKHISAQIINDETGKTLVVESSKKLGNSKAAYIVGLSLAKKAKKAKIKKVVFDRSGYKFHGRVAALAEGARDGGLEF